MASLQLGHGVSRSVWCTHEKCTLHNLRMTRCPTNGFIAALVGGEFVVCKTATNRLGTMSADDDTAVSRRRRGAQSQSATNLSSTARGSAPHRRRHDDSAIDHVTYRDMTSRKLLVSRNDVGAVRRAVCFRRMWDTCPPYPDICPSIHSKL